MTSTSTALKKVFGAGRPLVEQWLDIAEQMAALRDVAASQGLDWSQIKALLKAQVQDERDEAGDGKRVRKIIEKAEFASAYADMLGLNMNENNFSSAPVHHGEGAGESGEVAAVASPVEPPHDPETEPSYASTPNGMLWFSGLTTEAEVAAQMEAWKDGVLRPEWEFKESPAIVTETPSPAPVAVPPPGEEAGAAASLAVPASTEIDLTLPEFLDRRRMSA